METHSKRPNRNYVIVVDDDAAVRNSLKFSLEVEGFTVRAFADGGDLLCEADLADCCCLVIDQNMPRMSGLDVVAKLRNRDFLAPVILITGHPNAAVLKRATSADILIVEKPFLGNALIENIRVVISQRCKQGS
jgi:FixJ family two-component response regulator